MDLGKGGPQDLKNWNANKMIEHTVSKTTKKFFIKTKNNCKSYIVVDNLSFYKMQIFTYNSF